MNSLSIQKKALIVEDSDEARNELEFRSYACHSITHDQLKTNRFAEYVQMLKEGHYHILWIGLPVQ